MLHIYNVSVYGVWQWLTHVRRRKMAPVYRAVKTTVSVLTVPTPTCLALSAAFVLQDLLDQPASKVGHQFFFLVFHISLSLNREAAVRLSVNQSINQSINQSNHVMCH